MSPVMTTRIALKALARNKMRTALTMLGMIIGVSAVITLVALGSGAQVQIEEQIKAGGTNMVTVMAGNFTMGGVRGGVGAASSLKIEDVEAIKKEVPGRAIHRARREPARAGHRREPELVDAPGRHRRRLPAHPAMARQVRHVLQPAGRQQRVEGRRARQDGQRAAVRARCRSDRPDDPYPQSALQGDRDDGHEGSGSDGQRPGRHDLRALSRPCRSGCRDSRTFRTSRSRRRAPTPSPTSPMPSRSS